MAQIYLRFGHSTPDGWLIIGWLDLVEIFNLLELNLVDVEPGKNVSPDSPYLGLVTGLCRYKS